MISKIIHNVKYPIFVLKEIPFKVRYDDTSVSIIKQPAGKEYTFDMKVENIKNYTEKLFHMEEEIDNRIIFDYTVLNKEQLVFSYENAEWGVDQTGRIFNLSYKQNLPVECRKVTDVKKDKIWLEKVLAPFKLPITIDETNIEELWATIVNIKNEWYIKKFSYDYIKHNNFLVV